MLILFQDFINNYNRIVISIFTNPDRTKIVKKLCLILHMIN